MADRRRDAEFTEFAADTQQRLFRHAYLLTQDRHEAQDLVQTTLVSLYVAWPRVREPGAYAHRTLVHAFLDGRRRAGRERELHRLPDPPQDPGDPDAALTVLGALARLSPRHRAVVVLRYWEDLSVEQTAAVLDCSPGTVKSATSRALDQLRHHLGADLGVPLTTAPGGPQ